jgi:hypothetical protein
MKPKRHERGQALVIIALAVVGLFGLSALAIDGSRVFSDRRNAQNAADTAALAAALAQVRGDDYVQAGKDRAASNGYENDANSSVEVNLCSTAGLNPPCEGLPAGAHPSEFIQVKIVSTIPATFARILGRTHFTNVLTAVAHTEGLILEAPAMGNALAAMSREERDAVFGGGNVHLVVNGSGVFSNSTYTDPNCTHGSMMFSGTGTFTVDTGFYAAGSLCTRGWPRLEGEFQPTNPIPYPPTISIPIPNFSCNSAGTYTHDQATDTYVYSPGHHDRINISGNGKVLFNPGTYCISNGLMLTGREVIANDVRFLITGGELKMNGGSFTCNDVIVHMNGGRDISFNGDAKVFCNHVTFIASTGGVTFNGALENRIYAPTGGPYKGVLIYLPYPNESPIKLNGSSATELTGSIIGVAAPITVEGNQWTSGLNTQIIGYTVNLNGTGDQL